MCREIEPVVCYLFSYFHEKKSVRVLFRHANENKIFDLLSDKNFDETFAKRKQSNVD